MLVGFFIGWYRIARLLNLCNNQLAKDEYLLRVDLLFRGRASQLQNLVVVLDLHLVSHFDIST